MHKYYNVRRCKIELVRVVIQLGRKALMIGRPSRLHFEHAQKDYIMLKWKDLKNLVINFFGDDHHNGMVITFIVKLFTKYYRVVTLLYGNNLLPSGSKQSSIVTAFL